MADRLAGIVDLESCVPSYRWYGGDAGRKVGVRWDGADWLVKFPGSTRGRGYEGTVPTYTSSPMSEFLGSRVYACLGIPVHETVLAVREAKVVCACRDFTGSGRLVEFKNLKNSLSDEMPGYAQPASTGSGVVLADVRAAIHQIPVLRDIPGVSDRFWDMFVVDAFIRNVDRNNTNWGILVGDDVSLAPVYDNGSSFFSKRTPRQLALRLEDSDLIRQDAADVRSCFTTDTGRPIAPLKYIASGQDAECTAALGRFMERFDMRAFDALLDAIPEQAFGLTVISGDYREFHRRVIHERYAHVFVPAWKDLLSPRFVASSGSVVSGCVSDSADSMNPDTGNDPAPDLTR